MNTFGRARSRSGISRLLAGTLVALFAGAPLAATAGAASCAGVTERDTWTTIEGPRWSAGPDRIGAHAVDVVDASHLYATNGEVIAVSDDGGCGWQETYVGEGLTPGAGYEIESIVSPRPRRAVVTVREEVAGAPRPRIVVTDDGGESWRVAGEGLPPAGDPEFLRKPGEGGDVLFLGVDVGGGALDFLYWSTDGGSTWTLRSDLTEVAPNRGIRGVEVDPVDLTHMWAYADTGLYRSEDGGRSFQPVEEFAGEATGPVDLFHAPGEAARLIVFMPDSNQFQVSRDGGETWFQNASPSQVDAVDHGVFAEDVVITAHEHAYRYNDGLYMFFDLEAPSEVRGISAHRVPRVTYFAHSDTTIEWHVGEDEEDRDHEVLRKDRDISLPNRRGFVQKESRFGPEGRRLVLEAGERRTLRYRLRLPERRLPLDVFFLMDTTDSMDSVLDAAAEAMGRIMNNLARERLDVWFGLGEHRAYPDFFPPKAPCDRDADTKPPPQSCDHNFVYNQVVRLREGSDAQMVDALKGLQTAGGGIYDAQLGALYQVATGHGQRFDGAYSMHNVDPNQEAEWRDKALRVVVHPTDEAFGTPESGGDRGPIGPGSQVGPAPDIPSIDAVIEEFRKRDIRYVGISIGDVPQMKRDQRKVARETGAIAPTAIDCNGNGVADIAPGKPLVCEPARKEVDRADRVAGALIELLRSIPNRSDVGLEVRSGAPVVRNVTPEVHRSVQLQTSRELTFDVTYRCTRAQGGRTFPVRLGAVAEHLDLEVTTRVRCEEEPEEDEVLPPPLAALPLVGAVVPPVPPPPPATQLSQAPQLHSQAQAQAQAGAAHQEEEQPQTALVTAFGEAPEQEFAFSRYEARRRLPVEAALGASAVALGMMAATGTALARRTRLRRAR